MMNYKQESHLHRKLYLASQIMHKTLQCQNMCFITYPHCIIINTFIHLW